MSNKIFIAIFVVLWSYLLTTKLSCLQKNNFGHTMEYGSSPATEIGITVCLLIWDGKKIMEYNSSLEYQYLLFASCNFTSERWILQAQNKQRIWLIERKTLQSLIFAFSKYLSVYVWNHLQIPYFLNTLLRSGSEWPFDQA